jgi:hypothetical protein
MYPHERSLVKKMADKPFALIGVNTDGNKAELKKALVKEEISWRSFWNGKGGTTGPITKAWKITAFPSIFVIDAKGIIRYKNVRGEAMDKAVEALLAEMGNETAPTN